MERYNDKTIEVIAKVFELSRSGYPRRLMPEIVKNRFQDSLDKAQMGRKIIAQVGVSDSERRPGNSANRKIES